jgi:thiol-disulfide isomerase/thioredoxin
MKNWLWLGIPLLLLGCASEGTGVGSIAPELKAETLVEGTPVRLADYKGKVVVLDFWATWCGPCIEAMPHLVEAQKEYGDKVKILAITTEERDTVQRFLAQRPTSLTILRDPFVSTQTRYGVSGLPNTFVIGKDGKIAWESVGFDPQGFKNALEQATK